MTEEDIKHILKWIAYGGIAGGSASMLAGAVRLLNNEHFRSAKPTDGDDDVMYVVKKARTDEHDQSWDSTLIATIGAPLAAGGSFMLGNWLINRYMRDRAQQELDEAQKLFVDAQGYDELKKSGSVEKSAFDWFGIPDALGDMGSAIRAGGNTAVDYTLVPLGLMGLASAVTTYQYLKNAYPFDKPKKLPKPRKIVYVDNEEDINPAIPAAGQTGATGGYAATEKEASFREDNCMVSAARMLCDSNRDASVASGIIHAVAAGRLHEIEDTVKSAGFMAAADITKGASAKPVDRFARELATAYCVKLASFAPQFKLAVAADIAGLYPQIYKEASTIPDNVAQCIMDQQAHMECAAMMEYAAEKGYRPTEKQASVPQAYEIRDLVASCIEKLAASPIIDNIKEDSSDLSDGGKNENSARPKGTAANEEAKYNAATKASGDDEQDDAIDAMLGTKDKALPGFALAGRDMAASTTGN